MAELEAPVARGAAALLAIFELGVDAALKAIAHRVVEAGAAEPARALAQIGGQREIPVVAGCEEVAEIAQFPFALLRAKTQGPVAEAGGQDARLAVLAQGEHVEGDPE